VKIFKALSSVLTGSLILGLAAGAALADTFDQVNRGWVESTGRRMADSRNTYTGSLPPELHYNSFFVFDLGTLDGPVEAATLWLELEGYWGPDVSESFTVFDVVTDPLELEQDQADRTDIFEDLQSGAVYGMGEVSPADVGSVIEIQLSSEALADLDAAAGGLFAVGLHVEDIAGVASEEGMRWSLTGDERVHQLVLELGPSFAVQLDPEVELTPVNASQTLMAQVRDFRGDPVPDALVDFDVVDGPNAGTGGSVMTDAAGEAHFTYVGGGDNPGVDSILASFDSGGPEVFESEFATSFRDDDCNENGIADTCDVGCEGFDGMCADAYAECGGSADTDTDGGPDECYEASPPDPAPGPSCSDTYLSWLDRRECDRAALEALHRDRNWLLELFLNWRALREDRLGSDPRGHDTTHQWRGGERDAPDTGRRWTQSGRDDRRDNGRDSWHSSWQGERDTHERHDHRSRRSDHHERR
jgi:hypothetical protein